MKLARLTKWVITTLWLSSTTLYAAPSIYISDAWINAAPPVAKNLAGYLQLSNHSQATRLLQQASSPDFARVEFHASVVTQDRARMEARENITIAVGETIHFAPGGLHLMLINKKRSLGVGDTVAVTLVFDNGQQTILMPVKRASIEQPLHHQHH